MTGQTLYNNNISMDDAVKGKRGAAALRATGHASPIAAAAVA